MNHINSIGTKPTRSKLGWALVRDDVQAPGQRGAVMDGKDEGRGEGGGGVLERLEKEGWEEWKGKKDDGQRVRRESKVSRHRKRTTKKEEEEADGSQTLDWREGKGESPYK